MANVKISALTSDTSPTSDDLIPTVTDPAGTPASRKVTLADAITKAHGLSDGLVKVATGTMAVASAGTDYSTPSSTDVLTNKTFDANGTGNTLSNVEVADLAANAVVTAVEGLSSSDNDTSIPTTAAVIDGLDTKAATSHTHELADLDATGASDGHVLTADGAGGAAWEASVGGSGVYIPKLRLPFAMGTADTAAYGGSGVSSVSGAGATFTYNAGGGYRLIAGTSSTGFSRYLLRDQFTHELVGNAGNTFFDRDMWVGAGLTTNIKAANSYQDFFIGMGDVQVGISGIDTRKHLGLWVETRNNAITYYISVYDGTTATKTDITTAVTAVTNVNWSSYITNGNFWLLEFISGTSFKIYVDRTLVGTVTTNLPTGTMLNDYIAGTMLDAVTSNSVGNSFTVNHGFLEIDMFSY
jgi:hypothetical protein